LTKVLNNNNFPIKEKLIKTIKSNHENGLLRKKINTQKPMSEINNLLQTQIDTDNSYTLNKNQNRSFVYHKTPSSQINLSKIIS
jgi:hypothetical protein